MEQTSPIKISTHIQLGVTGHRDLNLTDEELKLSIREALTQALDKFIHAHKYHTQPTFSILTQLAEGADRVVAQEAMTLRNATLIVVLPMQDEDYFKDFTSLESRGEFSDLIKLSPQPARYLAKDLNEEFGKEHDDELGDDLQTTLKARAYAKASHYVVDNCDILIAVWNGEPGGPGGTADTVEYANKQKKPLIIVSTKQPGKIMCYHRKDIIRKLKKTEEFNERSLNEEDTAAAIVDFDKQFAFLHQPGVVDPLNIEIIETQLKPLYVKADMIASRNQKTYRVGGLIVYILSPIAVAAVAAGFLLAGNYPQPFAVAELCVLFVINAFAYFLERWEIRKKWIEYRFLSEHLRSAIYFVSFGIGLSSDKETALLRKPYAADIWAAEIFNEIIKKLKLVAPCTKEKIKQTAAYIKKHWINGQVEYHRGKMEKHHSNGEKLETAGTAIFVTAFVFAIIHTWIALTEGGRKQESIWPHIIEFVAIILPALGASISAIRIYREYSRLERQHKRMVFILEEFKSNCDAVETEIKFNELLSNIQIAMLKDVEGWVALMEGIKVEAT